MDSKNTQFPQIGFVAFGQVICTAAMIGVFALVGRYNTTVLLGGIAGALLATANYFILSYFVNKAMIKAQANDVAGGQKLIQLSYMGRMAGLLVCLILCAKSGYCHALALVIPLVFVRPLLSIAEIFKKKGDNEA
jgi:hypothetical protein